MATNKRAVEAWWGFLLGTIIVIIVVILVLYLYWQIKTGGEAASGGIMGQLAQAFK
jgi:small-conductance mechanosensitive channel